MEKSTKDRLTGGLIVGGFWGLAAFLVGLTGIVMSIEWWWWATLMGIIAGIMGFLVFWADTTEAVVNEP